MTLQDVALQLGLYIDGELVSGCTSKWETYMNHDIWSFCRELLGVIPEEPNLQQSTVKLTWFNTAFPTLDVDASKEMIARHTHAFILRLLGGFLMANALASRVSLKWLPLLRDFGEAGRLRWGFAVLVTLYRQLCHSVRHDVTNVARCLALLQLWA